MFLRSKRLAAIAVAGATLALAACASQSSMPAMSPFSQTNVVKKTNPYCAKPQSGWIFGGQCSTTVLAATGGTASMPAYSGITVKAVFPSGAKAGTILEVRDATGNKDVTGKSAGKAFPPYNHNGLVPVIYLKAKNLGKALTFSKTPQITVTDSKLVSGALCDLTQMKNDAWVTAPVLTAKVTSGTLTFRTFPQPQSIGADGTVFIAVACFPKG